MEPLSSPDGAPRAEAERPYVGADVEVLIGDKLLSCLTSEACVGQLDRLTSSRLHGKLPMPPAEPQQQLKRSKSVKEPMRWIYVNPEARF